jgi:hypothetical protein
MLSKISVDYRIYPLPAQLELAKEADRFIGFGRQIYMKF